MAEEFNINEVIASFLQQNIDKFLETGKDVIKTTSEKVRLQLDRTYQSYLRSVLEKHSRAKSFFIRDEPVYLYEFYVPLAVRHRGGVIDHPSVVDIQKVSRCSTVVGSAGSGKSMFMRHLLLNTVLSKFKVPVFIELRQFNAKNHDLNDLIVQTLKANKFNLDSGFIEKALRAGHFVLFLDGFDEVNQSKREEVSRNVQEFAKVYDQNTIVVSSRPDNQLEGWPDFAMMYL
jgi:predicted NACHT family NTPase